MTPKNLDYIIPPINSKEWFNEYIPCALLSVQAEEPFQIHEANDYYFDLIGYTREEVRELFQNVGFATLHPEDSDIAVQNFVYQMQNSAKGEFSLTCRLVNKTFGYKHVRFSGRRGHTTSGQAIMYLLITDMTDLIQTMQELEQAQEFNILISSFTENSYFDYNLDTDTMRYSNDFALRLGLPMVVTNYSKSPSMYHLLAPESRAVFESLFSNTTQGDHETEIHLISLANEDIWYKINYKNIFTDGISNRVIGKMLDITKHHIAMQQLTYQACHDNMTGLYRKTIAMHMVDEFLKLPTAFHASHALFMIDLDNFKNINDTFGHDFGDKVIKEAGEKIRRAFRNDDIVARFGGDEFVVFMKDYKTIDVVYNKAIMLCDSLRTSYSNGVRSVSISTSIGIATSPIDGTDYDSLAQRADSALYIAKTNGRDQFFKYP